MERLLLMWDEIDDLVGAARHVTLVAAEEVASLAVPAAAAAAASALGASLLGLAIHAHLALSSGLVQALIA